MTIENATQLWENVKNELRDTIDKATFSSLIEPITTVHKYSNGYIFLLVEKLLDKYRIERFLIEKLDSVVVKHTSEICKFKVITVEEANTEIKENSQNKLTNVDKIDGAMRKRTLRIDYTFNSFVAGESNRFAFTTALKVAESPFVAINPLYIFGESGLGKTHLMTAIGHYMLDNNVSSNVIYTTAQQFAEDYYRTCSKGTPAAFDTFYKYYQDADMLLVDDIQFLSGKESTQNEFFKIFEYLFENNKQIILTSDKPVDELKNVMTRLKTRFSYGLVVDVKKPNHNHRISILKNKLPFLVSNPNQVANDAIEFIATSFKDNVRELEGALRRFIYYCAASNLPYTLENANLSLDSIIPYSREDNLKDATDKQAKNIDLVKKVVSDYYKIKLSDLSANTRKKEIVFPRQMAIYLIRMFYNIQLKRIGDAFGGRDHATIAHAISRIENSISSDWAVKQDIDNLKKKLN